MSYQLQGRSYQLKDYLKRNNVIRMKVLKDGKVVWDYYANSNNPTPYGHHDLLANQLF
ncbi:DUF4342 domain-containing protein [Snodgrassella alvi]|uniref:DUF4342 domain-containing protein n=1 Tax=Snodgrassella alvi TaxID=1196083 RepID=UPI001C558BD1|nr:DUF4342 domain-containing protein [Snodgrassella alvi]